MPRRGASVEPSEDIEMRRSKLKAELDSHDEGGIPMQDLRQTLEDGGIIHKETRVCCKTTVVSGHMSKDRLDELLHQADDDGDKKITYEEFVELVTEDENLTGTERAGFKKSLANTAATYILCLDRKHGYLQHYKACPPPWFIITMCIADIVIFAIYAVELENTSTPVTATSGVPMYSPLVYRPTRRYEAWRFLTYMFIHMGYEHIIWNTVLRLFFGIPLELVHQWRVIILYLLGVLSGSLLHSIVDHDAALVGASGGVYALLGGHLASVVTNWNEMTYKGSKMKNGEERSCGEKVRLGCISFFSNLQVIVVFIIVGVLVGIDVGRAIYSRVTAVEQKVGFMAHFGGFFGGLLLGVPVLRNIYVHPWEKTLGYVFLLVYLVCVTIAVAFNGFYSGYPPTDWS